MANDPKDNKPGQQGAQGGAAAGAVNAANAGQGQQLHHAEAGAGAAGAAGAAAGAAGPVQPCKWDLFVKVHSQERFWPKDSFKIQACNLTGTGDLGAAAYSQATTMTSKVSPEAHFCGSGTKHYGVTATVKDLKKEKDWILAAGAHSKAHLAKDYVPVTLVDGMSGVRGKHVDLFIRHPLEVHLQLKFKDPENRVLFFPENFPVQVFKGATKVLEVKTGAKGILDFEMDRKFDFFTLKFGGNKVLISNGDGTQLTTVLKEWKDKKDLEAAKAKFFSPPNQWALIESDWAFSENPKFIDGKVAYKANEAKVYIWDDPSKDWVRRIGEKGSPVVLTLDPHWQFLRYEFFDRYYGHSDHGHVRVNTPTLFIDGYWSKTGHDRKREGSGFWTLKEAQPKVSVHCLPWIRQKDNTGADQKRPDKKALIAFERPEHTFIESVDPTTRKLSIIDPSKNKARFDPSADRLKLYDLPTLWKSTNYFARYKDAAGKLPGKFFEQWDLPDHLKSRNANTPMVFSLDDVVLTNSSNQTIKFLNTDLFAVFYHRFKQAYNEAANVSHVGVYNPGVVEPLDSGTLKGSDFNYVTDYPNWVRLVAGRSCLFDVFDQRTKGSVTGARAGIRYFNPAVSGVGPGNATPNMGNIKKRYFVLRPYFSMVYPLFTVQFLPEPACPTEDDGRFDMALIRCCDRDGNKELFMNLSYFRFLYKYLVANPAANPPVTGSALVGNAAGQKTYEHNAATNLMKRWNGADTADKDRAEFLPQDGVTKIHGEAIYYIQTVTKAAEAHYRMDVDNLAATNARAFMNSGNGTGSIDDLDFQPTNAFGDPLDFVFAHEFGHGTSLPDEYAEWWINCCDNGPGLPCNTPGDPFQEEGTSVDFTPNAVNKTLTSGWGMMNMAVKTRNRYFWHSAEWSHDLTKVPFFVKLGARDHYKVPGHPSFPKRIYTYWPVKAKISKTLGNHGKMDVYLHVMGEDEFTVTVLPGIWKTAGPIDGMLSILHRMRIRFPTGIAATPAQLRNAIRNAMIALSGKFFASGTADVKTDQGNKNIAINKAPVHFSPRFLIDPVDFLIDPNTNAAPTAKAKADYQANFNNLAANPGAQYNVKVIQSGPKAPANPGFNRGKFGLDYIVDLTKPVAVATAALTAQAKKFYVEMLGVAFNPASPNIKTGDLQPIAALVIKTNPNVGNLP